MQVEPKIMEHVKAILTKFGNKYISKDNLKKNQVIEDLDHYNPALMTALLSDELIHKVYTEKVLDTEIFKLNQFIEMFEYKDFWEDSYTKYQNEIGLTVNGEYLKNNSDVILDFPFKDCVLKASMSKEDMPKGENVNEPFLNETLAAAEIDELCEPKVFVNAKKYDKDGEQPVTAFSDDDNLVIKGNNLIALHNIKKRYANKIKSIVIDPPYYFDKNKGSDAFNYNSDFKLSTWLTFIKNRLEVASDLLSDDGFCIVIIGKDGYPYLKLLMDDIFSKESCVGTISWRKSDNQANIGELAQVTDYILIYKKKDAILNKLPLSEKAKKEYRYSDEKGLFRRGILLDKTRGRYYYNLTTPSGNTLTGPWMKSQDEFDKLCENNLIYWTKGGQEQPYKKIYLKDSKGQIVNDFWDTSYGTNQRGANEIIALFNKRVFDFPKPEKLLFNLITLTTNEHDIVLDFFMGSATTQAVAMKMHRRFIGIEQMDYINTVSVPRLQKVIAGEQGGISKDVNWQGGGSFVYAELMEKNMGFLKDLQKAQTLSELNEVYERMKQGADFDFKVDLAKFEQDRQEKQRSLDEQKQTLMRILDKNQLYYNEANLDDADVRELLSDGDYQFNQSFYQEKGEE